MLDLRSPRVEDRFRFITRRPKRPFKPKDGCFCRQPTKRGTHDTRRTTAPLRSCVANAQIGAAVVATFIVGGRSVGVCVFPATQASIMSAHSCSMWRRCYAYSALL